jgi:hypothetical protein
MELRDGSRRALDYYPLGERLRLRVVDGPAEVALGQTGRVAFDRLDESCLLVGVLERDEAERIGPSAEARALGAKEGLRNPRPPAALSGRLQLGLY